MRRRERSDRWVRQKPVWGDGGGRYDRRDWMPCRAAVKSALIMPTTGASLTLVLLAVDLDLRFAASFELAFAGFLAG